MWRIQHYIIKLRFRFWFWRRDIRWRKELMKATLDYNNNPTPANESWYNICKDTLEWIDKNRKRLT